jgi:seryl-tRNA synthetase
MKILIVFLIMIAGVFAANPDKFEDKADKIRINNFFKADAKLSRALYETDKLRAKYNAVVNVLALACEKKGMLLNLNEMRKPISCVVKEVPKKQEETK